MADPYFNDILLLSPFDEADGTASGWTDYSANANTWTKTDSGGTPCTIETSNTVQLFGANALYLKKISTDKQEIITITSTDYAMATSDQLTIEYWYYHVSSANTSTAPLVFQLSMVDTNDAQQEILWGNQYSTSANHQFRVKSGFYPSSISGYSVTTGEWHHIAIVLDPASSNVSCYIDGVRKSTATWTLDQNRPKCIVYVGGNFSGSSGNSWECYVADLRITRAARYSGASLDVPTERFQTQPDAEEQPLKTWHYVPGPMPWFN